MKKIFAILGINFLVISFVFTVPNNPLKADVPEKKYDAIWITCAYPLNNMKRNHCCWGTTWVICNEGPCGYMID